MVGRNRSKPADENAARADDLLRQQVSKNIRALLISARNGLSVAEMQRDYHNMLGKPLPFREMGYTTLLDLLKDLPNVTRPTWENGVLVLKGVADATTRHIASLVARQKSSSKRKTRITYYQPAPEPLVPHFVRTQLKELMTAYPSGLLGSMFCIAFSRRFGQELKFDKMGFKSLAGLLSSVSDIVQVEQMRGGGVRVYGKKHGLAASNTGKAPDPGDSYSIPTPSTPMVSLSTLDRRNQGVKVKQAASVVSIKAKLDSKSGIDERLKEECKQVLARRPNGIWAARFAIEYKNLHSKELNLKQLGFMSMVEFMSAMPDVVRIERPTKFDWLLFEVKEEKEEDYSKSNGEVHEPKETCKEPIPSFVPGNPLNLPDGIGRGIYFKKIEPPECGYIEVCVTHVVDPHRFWVMLVENWPSLEALTEDMRCFYSGQESSRYKMPEWFISVGQVCCALYEDGSWYRGLVVGIQSVNSIEVFYVDYGNSARLPLSSLRVLRSQFIKLPAQGIPAKLAYIQPFGGGTDWSPGSTLRLYHLTKDYRQLIGIVCGVQEGTLSLCLCDTSALEDLHINDELVKEGYAFAVLQPENPRVAGQDHDREAPSLPQHQHTPGLPLLNQGPIYTNHHLPNIPCAPPANPSLLPDFPLQIAMAYSSEMTCWLNQTAQLTNGFAGPYVQSQQLNPVIQPNAHLGADDLELMKEINQELEVNMAEPMGLIKRIRVVDRRYIHVINYEKKPCLISAEISALFWDSDLLRSMLRQKKKTVAKVVVSFAENERWFKELIRCDVAGVKDGDEPRSFVTLYELAALPDILRTFGHPSEELLFLVNDEIECFKRQGDDYWFTKKKEECNPETGSSSEELISETELGIEELQLLLQAMQFRRKRILQGLLLSPTDPNCGQVDELREVEIKIEGLRQEIQYKEQKNTITLRTQPPPPRTA